MKKLLVTICLMSNVIFASDRIYIDEHEVDKSGHCFHVHTGGNIWYETETLNRDTSGLYVFERNLIKDKKSTAYERKWKCPYCFMYWKIGEPCQNPDCPSKYK